MKWRMVNCTSIAIPMTMTGAMKRFTPICIHTQKRTMWSRKFTPWLPLNPMKRFHDGVVWKVKYVVVK